MVGTSRGNPDFELPANFFDGCRMAHRPVKLDFHKLPDMALRTLNAHLSPVYDGLFLPVLVFQSMASLLSVIALYYL